jgi:hypothetical protein
MKAHHRRLLATFLSICVLLALLSVSAFAEKTQGGESVLLTYRVLYLDSSADCGYTYGEPWYADFTCQITRSHDTAASHTISYEEIGAQKTAGEEMCGRAIVGWTTGEGGTVNVSKYNVDFSGDKTVSVKGDTTVYFIVPEQPAETPEQGASENTEQGAPENTDQGASETPEQNIPENTDQSVSEVPEQNVPQSPSVPEVPEQETETYTVTYGEPEDLYWGMDSLTLPDDTPTALASGETFTPGTPRWSGEWVYDFQYWQGSDGRQYPANQPITVTEDLTLRPVWSLRTVSGDGAWNNDDLIILQVYLDDPENSGATVAQLSCADRDGDGQVDWADYNLIRAGISNGTLR